MTRAFQGAGVSKSRSAIVGNSSHVFQPRFESTMKLFDKLGPGFLVTAAFIGPGTVTTASKAGAAFGFALVWALVFSVFATIVLQDMCARLGLVTGAGLGDAIRVTFTQSFWRRLTAALVVGAITFGNAAFQTGNVAGAAAGAHAITSIDMRAWAIAIGIIAFALLALGAYRTLEKVLIVLVILMSAVFLVTAVLVRPSPGELLAGIVPSVPDGSLITIVALIGTTVVPYNLFLHSRAVVERWSGEMPLHDALAAARRDTSSAVVVGGLITLAVMATAAATFFSTSTTFETVGEMADQLGPLFGSTARIFFAIGLLASGLTSAITAPLAGAYATAGVMGWNSDLRDPRLRLIWGAIIVMGSGFAAMATKPVTVILFAQAANGILLPVMAAFLLIVMNRRELLGEHVNSRANNISGLLVLAIAAGLGGFQLLKAMQSLLGLA